MNLLGVQNKQRVWHWHSTCLLKYNDDKFRNICALTYTLYVR